MRIVILMRLVIMMHFTGFDARSESSFWSRCALIDVPKIFAASSEILLL